MFQGFNEATIKYYEAIRRENSRSNYKTYESLYFEGVKQPLEELYYELFNYFSNVDNALLGSKRRCISSAYNDARFCREEPIKEYLFKLLYRCFTDRRFNLYICKRQFSCCLIADQHCYF